MKKIKFLIIGSEKSANNQDLAAEIRKQGHSGRIISPDELLLAFDAETKGFRFSRGRVDLDNHDVFIFRGYEVSRVQAQILAERMLFLGKVVLDEVIGRNFIVGKMYAASEFAQNGIDHITTYEAMNFSDAEKVIKRIRLPFIVKADDSRKGQDMYRFTNKAEALTFLRDHEGRYLIQEYIPIRYDYRVMVVNGKVLGAMKRYTPADDFRTNQYGTRAESVEMNEGLKAIAVRATKAMNYDIAGVDVLEENGKFKIIEVNIAPEWQKFKEVTGINPAEEIIRMAISRHRKKRLYGVMRSCLAFFQGRGSRS